MGQKQTLISIVLIAIIIGSGLFVWYTWSTMDSSNREMTQTPEETPKEAVVPEPVVHLGGIIKEVSGNSVIITVISLGGEDLDPALAERTVTIADDTTITLTTVPNPEGARREMDAFQAEMGEYMAAVKKFQDENGLEAKLPEELVPPTPPTANLKRETETADALKVGQMVSITTETDVRTEENFTAKTVEILPAIPGSAEVIPPKPTE